MIESREELFGILDSDEMRGVPVVVVANKQDLPGKFYKTFQNIQERFIIQCPKFLKRVITPEKSYNLFSSNFHQVIYSSSPISWPSFKPLA